MSKYFTTIIYFINILISKLIYIITRRDISLHLYEMFRKNAYKSLIINGRKIKFFNPNSITNWRLDTFKVKEPETLNWIDSFRSDKKIIFWDIGANIGLYSIYSVIKHKNIQVVSFEPSTLNLNILSRNISINKLEKNISIAQFALTDSVNQFLSMNETSTLEGGALSSFGVDFDGDGKKINSSFKYKIYGTSIDYLISQNILEIPNYIKMDVDGIEHLIIKGGSKTLSSNKIKSILVELNENFKEQSEQVRKALFNHGFRLKLKTRSEMVEKDHKDSKVYNFIFSK